MYPNINQLKNFLLILFLIIFTNLSVWSQKYTLEYNLKNGDQYITEFFTDASIRQTVMGIEQNISMNMETDFSMEVSGITDNSDYKLITEYRRMYMLISSSFFSMEIDTDLKKRDDFLNNMISKVLNKPISLEISRLGEIRNIAGVNHLIDGLFNDLSTNDEQNEQIKQFFLNNMGEESLRQNFSQYFCPYPEHPVRKNEPWDVNYEVTQSEMTLEFTGNGKIVEVNPRTLLIRIEGSMATSNINLDEYNDQFFLLKGTQVSEITVDRRTGWPLNSTTNQNISGFLHVNIPGGENETLEIPMQMKMRVNTKSSILK